MAKTTPNLPSVILLSVWIPKLRELLVDWYQIWKNEDGTLPTIDEAQALYDVWRTNPD